MREVRGVVEMRGMVVRSEEKQLESSRSPGPVVEATQDWLAGIDKGTTRRSYRAGLSDFVAWVGRKGLGGPLDLDGLPVNLGEHISARTLRRYVEALQERGNSVATIKHRLSVIRRWVKELERNELIHPGRAEAIYHVESPRGTNGCARSFLMEEEVQAVIDRMGKERLIDKRDRALIGLLYWTGLRRSELCKARLGQYKTVKGHKIIDGVERKGHNQDWVKIQVPLQRALEEWWEAAGLSEPGEPLFCAVDKAGRVNGKEPLSANGVYLIVKKRAEAAGFEGITPHALRRSMATNMDLKGVPVSHIKAAGGWKSRAMLDIYIQQSASLDDNGTDRLRLAL